MGILITCTDACPWPGASRANCLPATSADVLPPAFVGGLQRLPGGLEVRSALPLHSLHLLVDTVCTCAIVMQAST